MKRRPTAFRYFYQPISASPSGCWLYLSAALNTPEGAAALVERFSRRDRGKYRWRCAPVLPTDFDWPLRKR
ncbi:MAG: hypothetical protein ABIH03_02305 [Pseudomonadota bacterium]